MIEKRPLLALLILLAGWCAGGRMAAAQPVVIDHEYEYKAAYLYHFARLVDWPDNGRDRIVIGVLGENQFGRQLARIERQSEDWERPIDTKEFASLENYRSYLQESQQPCEILFVSGQDENARRRLEEVVENTEGHRTLFFTEIRESSRRGGAVNFYIDNNRLKLEVNSAATRGITIPRELLQLRSVTQTPTPVTSQ